MNKTLLALSLLATFALGCGNSPSERQAWAVGTYIGGSSILLGPSSCTYDAPAAVAELSHNSEGHAFMAKLIGEGTITQLCDGRKTVFDVLEATSLRIDGPDTVAVGISESELFRVTPLAGKRELRGVHQGGPQPAWSLGADCNGVATFAPVLGSQDTGGSDITRKLVPTKAGTCTITAKILGLTGTKKVTIQ